MSYRNVHILHLNSTSVLGSFWSVIAVVTLFLSFLDVTTVHKFGGLLKSFLLTIYLMKNTLKTAIL